jgi:hypothetical protein
MSCCTKEEECDIIKVRGSTAEAYIGQPTPTWGMYLRGSLPPDLVTGIPLAK